MDNFYERHLCDFYSYIIKNERQIKHEVRKNITYEKELFEETYSDTIVKVASAIIDNHKVIEDFRYFFFISFKQNYIQSQNKRRKADKLRTYGYKECESLMSDNTDDEQRYERIKALFRWLSQYLEGYFPPGEVDIYIVYYFLKAGKNRISYKKLADIYNVDLKYITNVIQNIKRFVGNNEAINKKKEEILYDGDFDFVNT